MASVDFQLRSVKINDPFSVRLRFLSGGNYHILESKTELYIFTPEEVLQSPLVNGKKFWNDNKKKLKIDLEKRTRIVRIQNDQENLRKFILAAYNLENFNDRKLPSKEWLQSIVKEYYNNLKRIQDDKEQSEKPLNIQWRFDNYIKLKKYSLAERTVMKLENAKKILKGFEEYQSKLKGFDVKHLITDVSPEFQYHLEEYLSRELLYSPNTIAKTIKILKTICNYSSKIGIQLHKEYGLVGKAYLEKDVVYLSFEELQKIKKETMPKELEEARDWLYMSCFLGQRISDFMRFNSKMLRKDGKDYFIDFIQEKTNKKIPLLLHPEVIDILQKRNMEFPPKMEESIYNDAIKLVCKEAKILEEIEGTILTEVKKGVWRDQKGIFPKYKLIGSHIGRKSYCTNFYSKIPTSLILKVSGHTEERTLLQYIGKKDATDSELIKNYYGKVDVTKD